MVVCVSEYALVLKMEGGLRVELSLSRIKIPGVVGYVDGFNCDGEVLNPSGSEVTKLPPKSRVVPDKDIFIRKILLF